MLAMGEVYAPPTRIFGTTAQHPCILRLTLCNASHSFSLCNQPTMPSLYQIFHTAIFNQPDDLRCKYRKSYCENENHTHFIATNIITRKQ